MSLTISVVIPAYNAGEFLPLCLRALSGSLNRPFETIVVDDGSKDDTRKIANQFGATVLTTGHPMGPAFARNLGAKAARGNVLFFLDSDVCVQPDTLLKIERSFTEDAGLDAVIGSYDSEPTSPDFISQYRNLMHCFVHQKGAERASTFWSGCGAIWREVFFEHSGFSEEYERPAIEDIELGYRLIRAGHKIVLDRSILVSHLKQWTFWSLVKTDILDRGIPWTELILRDRCMPNDLNLQLSQRVSVALVFILVALAVAVATLSGAYLLIPCLVIVFLMLAHWWGEIGNYQPPRRAYVMLSGALTLAGLLAFWQKMFGLIPFLAVMPVLLLLRHRYNRSGRLTKSHRWWGILFIYGSVISAAMYLPTHRLILACFVVILILGLLNSQFYLFLAGKRGIAFMLAAIPFHLLYHFYNGVSFIIGAGSHLWTRSMQESLAQRPPETKQAQR